MNENSNGLYEMLDRFAQTKVLVVGDVMIDRYLSGSIDRMSPEAQVPVLAYNDTTNRLGGAANVALNLKGLGAKATLTSVIGQDNDGALLADLLNEAGLSSAYLVPRKERLTTVKTRVMAGDQHMLRVDREQKDDINSSTESQLWAQIQPLIEAQAVDAIILQDYDKGLLTEKLIRKTIALANHHGIQIYVDPKFNQFFSYQNVTLFKPNLMELRAQVPFEVGINSTDLIRATNFIRQKLSCKQVLVTLSGDGIALKEMDNFFWLPAAQREIVDVCGAGDTVISMATLAHQAGIVGRQLAEWCTLAGTAVCQFAGVQPITREVFIEEVNRSLENIL